jgi:hypothetical protein
MWKGGMVVEIEFLLKNITYNLHFCQLLKFPTKQCYATLSILIHTADSDMKLSKSTHRIHWCVSIAEWLCYRIPTLPILCYLCTWNASLGYIKKLFVLVNNELWKARWRNRDILFEGIFPELLGIMQNMVILWSCLRVFSWTHERVLSFPMLRLTGLTTDSSDVKTDESWNSIRSYTQFRKAFLAIY